MKIIRCCMAVACAIFVTSAFVVPVSADGKRISTHIGDEVAPETLDAAFDSFKLTVQNNGESGKVVRCDVYFGHPDSASQKVSQLIAAPGEVKWLKFPSTYKKSQDRYWIKLKAVKRNSVRIGEKEEDKKYYDQLDKENRIVSATAILKGYSTPTVKDATDR